MTSSAFQPTVLTVPSTGGGTGQGELNIVTNSIAASDTTGWSAVGPAATLGRGTSGGPLSPTIGTYFTIINTVGSPTESSTSGAYSVLTMPSGMQNRKLKVEFYFTSPATDTFSVSVYKGTTRVPLTTDSAGATNLPKSTTGKFTAYFDTDSSGTWTVSITRTAGTGVTPLQFTNVVVGPGIQPQGAVVGEWQTYTAGASDWSASGAGPSLGNGTLNYRYRRVGETMQVRVGLTMGSTTTFGTGVYVWKVPAGLTIDTTKLAQTATTTGASAPGVLGEATALDLSPGAFYYGQVVMYSSTYVSIIGGTAAKWGQTFPVTWASGDEVSLDFTVPIAEWAGSGTVQLAQNDVEYASNDGSAGTAAGTQYTTGMKYGPAGSAFVGVSSGTVLNASTDYLVQFQTPLQVGDRIDLEVMNTGNGNSTWGLVGQWRYTNLSVLTKQATAVYGMGWYPHPTDKTKIYVAFGNYGRDPTNTNYATAGQAWSDLAGGSYYWRVRKSSAGAAVGFGIVVPGTSSGLVSASGLPGNTTGNAIASGYVGELLGTLRSGTGGSVYSTRSTTVVATASSESNCVSLTLNKGIYLVSYIISGVNSDAAARRLFHKLKVGGTDVTATYFGISIPAAEYINVGATIPVLVSTDSTVVAAYGQTTATSFTSNNHEMWAIRLG